MFQAPHRNPHAMFAAVCVAALLACAAASGEWTNTKVKRSIDLTSQVVKEVTVVTAKGTGEADSRAVYKLSFADADVANTAFLQVKSGDATLNTVKLPSL